jgi:hypothetical protein
MEGIICLMRDGNGGLEIKDRKKMFKTYLTTAVGMYPYQSDMEV